MYAYGNIIHNGTLIPHGTQVNMKTHGLTREDMAALEENGALVEDEPEPAATTGGDQILQLANKLSEQARKQGKTTSANTVKNAAQQELDDEKAAEAEDEDEE